MTASRRPPRAAGKCPLPFLHRAYQAAVVGIAVFFAAMILLREPFRGYQAEVRLQGRAAAAFDADALRAWLRGVDAKAAVAVSGGNADRPLEIRIGRVAPRLPEARSTLDRLGRRVLVEYLPQVHSDHRRGTIEQLQQDLNAASAAEESLIARSRALTQQQEEQRRAEIAPAPADLAAAPAAAPAADSSTEKNPLQELLAKLRLDLAGLLANFTDEHPQVMALRRQIENVELQLQTPEPASAFGVQAAAGASAPTYTSFPISREAGSAAADASLLDAELERIVGEIKLATEARQAAERKLQATLASFSVESSATAWTLEPSRLVARLGGTPRMLPLLVASIVSTLCALVVFRLATLAAGSRMLETEADLCRALPIPLVGLAPAGSKAIAPRRGWLTSSRIHALVRAAELWLIAVALGCTLAICLDSSLAAQLPADPLGVFSEIVGRIAGA
jgi:hypothetical protein